MNKDQLQIDNPIKRTGAIGWAVTITLVFAIVLAGAWVYQQNTPETVLEDVVAQKRYQIRQKVEQEQAAELSKDAIQAAIPTTAAKLVATKPAVVAPATAPVAPSPAPATVAPAPAVVPSPAPSEVQTDGQTPKP